MIQPAAHIVPPPSGSHRLVALALLALGLAGVFLAFMLGRAYYWPDADGFVRRDGQVAAFFGADYLDLWAGARLALQGGVATVFAGSGIDHTLDAMFGFDFPEHLWSYPPTYLLIVLPLGLMPYGLSFVLKTTATLVAYLWAAPARQDGAPRLEAAAALLMSPAAIINLFCGQNGFVTAALMISGLRVVDARPRLAGLLFGVLTFKPHIGLTIAVAVVALGRWTTFAWAAGTAAALGLVSLLVFGPGAWIDFFQQTLVEQTLLFVRVEGFFREMMPSPYIALRLLDLDLWSAAWIQAGTTVAVCGLCAASVRRTDDPDRRIAIVAVTGLLATPYCFNYDMTAVSAAILPFLLGRRPCGVATRFILMAVWLLPALVMILNPMHWPLGPVILGSAALALALEAMPARAAAADESLDGLVLDGLAEA